MPTYTTTTSIQESAAQFANTILASINAAASELIGVDVMWFRADPDKRSQDVIFQSYTLYGVDDCPLNFRAVYKDSGYDDGVITYNVLGIEYQVPLTLDIALNTWKEATGNDGTIPQQHDIVYIPMNRKLLEVVSMQPVKQLGGQLTSYLVNLSIYKPTRSRLVGENLKESIKNNTTNLEERFGEDIITDINNIIDDDQLSLYNSTNVDPKKEVSVEKTNESGILDVRTIVNENVYVDGHTVARNYYKMQSTNSIVVKYNSPDKFTTKDERCFTCWFKPIDPINPNNIKNNKSEISIEIGSEYAYILAKTGSKFKIGDNVVFKRGKIIVPGVIVEKDKIRINRKQALSLNKISPIWYSLPGFVIITDNKINLLSGGEFSIDIKASSFVSISYKNKEELFQVPVDFNSSQWYGVCVNISSNIKVDVYESLPKLKNILSSQEIKNEITEDVDVENYYIKSSDSNITNIRLYDTTETNIDKQITDLVSYNVRNDANCIVNDDALTYLSKPYFGKQR